MDISKIKERFELLKKLCGTNVVLISKIAKELKVRETDLMLLLKKILSSLKRNTSIQLGEKGTPIQW